MDFDYYLEKFRKAAEGIDKKMLREKPLNIYIGVTLNSVVLKLYKTEWASDKIDPIHASSRIFFAIWVNEKTISRKKIFYNIHALKLRKLKGYAIRSHDFADSFRKDFMKFEHNWGNVSVKFGPLTLMEGWEHFENERLEGIIVKLANNFTTMEHLIDNTLKKFKLDKIEAGTHIGL